MDDSLGSAMTMDGLLNLLKNDRLVSVTLLDQILQKYEVINLEKRFIRTSIG
jgi:hypothetical protein